VTGGLALFGGPKTAAGPFPAWPRLSDKAQAEAAATLASGRLVQSTGTRVGAFESAFAAWIGVPHAVAVAFIVFRVLQNIPIFASAFFYFRRAGLPAAHAFAGLCMLSWSMLTSLYNSDLSFNTYFDILFFLLAGLAILGRKPLWILPLSVLAAFNRETGVLIPLMLLAVQLRAAPGKERNAAVAIGALSLVLNAAVFFGLRIAYGPQEMVLSFVGLTPGAEVLAYNLFRPLTWVILINMMGIVPLLALFSYPGWRSELKAFFWVVVPVWLLVHAVASIMAECRVFLVPQTMFFIPGALLLLRSAGGPQRESGK
jgi:hypothetical protein